LSSQGKPEELRHGKLPTRVYFLLAPKMTSHGSTADAPLPLAAFPSDHLGECEEQPTPSKAIQLASRAELQVEDCARTRKRLSQEEGPSGTTGAQNGWRLQCCRRRKAAQCDGQGQAHVRGCGDVEGGGARAELGQASLSPKTGKRIFVSIFNAVTGVIEKQLDVSPQTTVAELKKTCQWDSPFVERHLLSDGEQLALDQVLGPLCAQKSSLQLTSVLCPRPHCEVRTGTNVVGICATSGCEAEGLQVAHQAGCGSMDLLRDVARCPACGAGFRPAQLWFSECEWKLEMMAAGAEWHQLPVRTEWSRAPNRLVHLEEFAPRGARVVDARVSSRS